MSSSTGGFTSGSGSLFLYGDCVRDVGPSNRLARWDSWVTGICRSRRAGRELGHTGSTECLAMGRDNIAALAAIRAPSISGSPPEGSAWRRCSGRLRQGSSARHRAERGCMCTRCARGTVGRAPGVGLGHRVLHQELLEHVPRRARGRHRRVGSDARSGHDAASFSGRRTCLLPTIRWHGGQWRRSRCRLVDGRTGTS